MEALLKEKVGFKAFTSNRNVVCTVAELIGENGTIGRSPKNWVDETKRISLELLDSTGDGGWMSCSDAVSKLLRNKEITIEHVMKFEIMKTDNDICFISLPPSASQVERKSAKGIQAKDFVRKMDVSAAPAW